MDYFGNITITFLPELRFIHRSHGSIDVYSNLGRDSDRPVGRWVPLGSRLYWEPKDPRNPQAGLIALSFPNNADGLRTAINFTYRHMGATTGEEHFDQYPGTTKRTTEDIMEPETDEEREARWKIEDENERRIRKEEKARADAQGIQVCYDCERIDCICEAC